MTDAQFYNVMFITGAAQVLAIIFCGMAAFIPRLSKELRELFLLLWMILSGFLPYLETGIHYAFRIAMIAALVWGACYFAKYFGSKRRQVGFYIQLFVSYLAAVGYLLAALTR